MTTDIRTAAQWEAEQLWPKPTPSDIDPMPYDGLKFERAIFVDGAVWAAERVTPTHAQIERAIMGRTSAAGARGVLKLMQELAEGERS